MLGGRNAHLVNRNQSLTKENQQLVAVGLRQSQLFLADSTHVWPIPDVDGGTALASADPTHAPESSSRIESQDEQLEEATLMQTLSTLDRLKRVLHVPHAANCADGAPTSTRIDPPKTTYSPARCEDGEKGRGAKGDCRPAAARSASTIKVDERSW